MPLFIACFSFITMTSVLYFALPAAEPLVQGVLVKRQVRYRSWSRELFWDWSETKISRMVWLEIGAMIVTFFVFRVLSGSWLLAGLLTLVGSYVPSRLYNRTKSQRRKAITQDLPEAGRMVIQHLRANRTMEKAIGLTGEALRERPIGQEFSLIAKDVHGNLSLEAALTSACDRIGTEAFTMMATAFIFAHKKGNALALLKNVYRTIDELNQVEQKVHIEVAGVRSQKKVISWMLPGFLGLVCLFDPGIPQILFHTTIGFVLLAISFGLWQTSIFLMNKILKSVL